MNRGRKCGGFKFEENRVGFYGVSVLALGDISDNAARRNCRGNVNDTKFCCLCLVVSSVVICVKKWKI